MENRSLGMKIRNFAQDTYFRYFNEYLFTTISRVDTKYAEAIVNLYYRNRPWNEYPIFCSTDRKDLLFVHIPKCGGTSVANSLGLSLIRHFPASVFYLSDRKKFSNARLFAVVRNPLDRLLSILKHFNYSIFATDREKEIFSNLNITEENIEEHLILLLGDKSFRRRLFINTQAGWSGLYTNQSDFLIHKNKLLVKNLFTLERIDVLEKWLSSQLGEAIKIGHSNFSYQKKKLEPSKRLITATEKYLEMDNQIFQNLTKVGGYALENTCELETIEQVIKSTYCFY